MTIELTDFYVANSTQQDFTQNNLKRSIGQRVVESVQERLRLQKPDFLVSQSLG